MQTGWASMLEYRAENGEKLFSSDLSPKLIAAFENCFYAGGKHVLDSLVYDAALDEGDELTEADSSKLDALMHEILEYFSKISREGAEVN